MPNFTTEDLLLYIYNELNEEQRKQLDAALKTDWALQQKLQVLLQAKDQLKQENLSAPRQHSIDIIMRYAKTHSPVLN